MNFKQNYPIERPHYVISGLFAVLSLRYRNDFIYTVFIRIIIWFDIYKTYYHYGAIIFGNIIYIFGIILSNESLRYHYFRLENFWLHQKIYRKIPKSLYRDISLLTPSSDVPQLLTFCHARDSSGHNFQIRAEKRLCFFLQKLSHNNISLLHYFYCR